MNKTTVRLIILSCLILLVFLSPLFPDIFLNKAKKAYKLSNAEDRIQDKKEPPAILITVPLPGQSISGILTVLGTASDNYGVIKIEIQIGDKDKVLLYAGDPVKSKEFEYQFNSNEIANGKLAIKITTSDSMNNQTEETIQVYINNASSYNVVRQPVNFEISSNRFYLNAGEFRIKSIALEPFMPGETPQDYPVKLNYTNALSNMKAMNANTVYLLTGASSNLQASFFERAKVEGLYIILGLWFSAVADDYVGHSYDFQNSFFKDHVKDLIRQFINKLHNINGVNYSDQVLYLTLGNEFIDTAINNTTTLHPSITSYSGRYVSITGATPTECFLAEMMDYCKTYEADNYHEIHYISHHTWPVVSPSLTKNSFLDVISYNLYSYWPPFVSGHSGGSVTGTPYQGALEELATNYPGKPFVVSEFGISVASSNVTIGTNLTGQSNEIVSRWQDIITAVPYVVGGSIHEYMDQWWKDDGVAPPPDGPDEDEHDPTDREEYFGLMAIEGTVAVPIFSRRPSFYGVKKMYE